MKFVLPSLKVLLAGLLILFLSSCSNTTTIHLPERDDSFMIYNYQLEDGCIQFKRDPEASKQETICNENFWFETDANLLTTNNL